MTGSRGPLPTGWFWLDVASGRTGGRPEGKRGRVSEHPAGPSAPGALLPRAGPSCTCGLCWGKPPPVALSPHPGLPLSLTLDLLLSGWSPQRPAPRTSVHHSPLAFTASLPGRGPDGCTQPRGGPVPPGVKGSFQLSSLPFSIALLGL